MPRWFLSTPRVPLERLYRILVVEDDFVSRNVIIDALLPWTHFHVNTVETGTEAVAKGYSEPYDLIILDDHLPDMDGIAVFRSLREKRPVCVLGISDDPQLTDAALLAEGFAGFLAKPFTVSVLLEQVARLLDMPSPRTPYLAPPGAAQAFPPERTR